MNTFIQNCKKFIFFGESVYVFTFFVSGKGEYLIAVKVSELETTKDIVEARAKAILKFQPIYASILAGTTTPTLPIDIGDRIVVFA